MSVSDMTPREGDGYALARIRFVGVRIAAGGQSLKVSLFTDFHAPLVTS